MPLKHTDSNDKGRQDEGNGNQDLTELLEPALKRGSHRFSFLDHIGDLPHGRIHSDGCDDTQPVPPGDECAHERHVFHVPEVQPLTVEGLGRF